MSEQAHKKTRQAVRSKGDWRAMAAAATVGGLLIAALASGLYRSAARSSRHAQTKPGDQDSLAVFSSGRTAKGRAGAQAQPGVVNREVNREAEEKARAEKQAAEKQQQAVAVQQAALAEEQRQLQLQAAEQAAREKQLEEDRQRIEAEKQQAGAAAAEAERQRIAAAQEAERLRKQPAFDGPSSGSIVWQGDVNGTTLVTIEGNSSDTGQVISGALPGVLVVVQPADAKHVGVASAPAPSNGYRRLMLRVQGKGAMQEVVHWSIP